MGYPLNFPLNVEHVPLHFSPGSRRAVKLPKYDLTWQARHIHLLFPEESPDGRMSVYIGERGLYGGGNSHSSCGSYICSSCGFECPSNYCYYKCTHINNHDCCGRREAIRKAQREREERARRAREARERQEQARKVQEEKEAIEKSEREKVIRAGTRSSTQQAIEASDEEAVKKKQTRTTHWDRDQLEVEVLLQPPPYQEEEAYCSIFTTFPQPKEDGLPREDLFNNGLSPPTLESRDPSEDSDTQKLRQKRKLRERIEACIRSHYSKAQLTKDEEETFRDYLLPIFKEKLSKSSLSTLERTWFYYNRHCPFYPHIDILVTSPAERWVELFLHDDIIGLPPTQEQKEEIEKLDDRISNLRSLSSGNIT